MNQKAQVWIFCRHPHPQVLLFRVQPGRGGFWAPVTGKVEEGESVEAGALRELSEETGFQIPRESLRDLQHRFAFEGRWGPAEEFAFAVELDHPAPPKLDEHEHSGAEWVSFEEAERRIPFEQQKIALHKLSAVMTKARG